MKLITAALVFGALAPSIDAAKIHVSTSDRLIEVGNLDLFATTWKAIYEDPTNLHQVSVKDEEFSTQSKHCNFDNGPDHKVTVSIIGKWNDVDGKHLQVRDAMVEAAWETVKRIAEKHQYEVYVDCCADTIAVNCNKFGAACSDRVCKCPGEGRSAKCNKLRTGHQVPALIYVTADTDGSNTQNNEILIEFSSEAAENRGGCGAIDDVIQVFKGWLFPPVIAEVVGKGIELGCGK
ncbi:hypothetical protein BN1723_002740 [Verticillium longisporum]|uniref:Uncharacterized protein n=1 Tax=Verticillium longisporum TaxID=100787 RepID=A0A0G4LHV5_VERLO|nr:hypothetical protein HYQ44_006089 [Verticillium longisporum]CRK21616.1 hypothetical protein BN1723_002740 [Verticillium longisporum]CRK29217.1 hypothetical protein BN1708_004894 [Verticillium longisporum]